MERTPNILGNYMNKIQYFKIIFGSVYLEIGLFGIRIQVKLKLHSVVAFYCPYSTKLDSHLFSSKIGEMALLFNAQNYHSVFWILYQVLIKQSLNDGTWNKYFTNNS